MARDTSKLVAIPGELHSAATDGIVTATEEVFDYDSSLFQSQINSNFYNASQHSHEITEVTTTARTVVYAGNITSGFDDASILSDNTTVSSTRTETSTGQTSDSSVDSSTRTYDDTVDQTTVVWTTIRTNIGQRNDYTFEEAVNSVPASYRHGGLNLSFISNENVTNSDNKYVQFRLMKHEWSTDVTDWSFCGDNVLIDNPEYIAVWTDSDKRILLAIENDGNVIFGYGVPKQIANYIQQKIDELYHDKVEDVVAFIGNLLEDDKTLSELFGEKVDKEEGKSLIPIQYIQEIDNPEYIAVWTDSDKRILLCIKNDGDIYFGYGIPSQIMSVINDLQILIGTQNNKIDGLQTLIEILNNKIDSLDSAQGIVDNGFFAIRKMIKEDAPYYLSSYADNIDEAHTTAPTSYNDDAYLDEKIKSVPDGKHFIFVTDTHWTSNYRKSMYLIEYIRRKMCIKNIVFGGDAINHYNDKYLAAQQLGLFADEFCAISGLNALYAQGNHDGNRVGHNVYPDVPANEIYIDDDYIYKKTVKPIEAKVVFNTELIDKIAALTISASDKALLTYWAKCHYYYDDTENKVRYIVMNTYNDSYAQCEIYKRNGSDAMMCQFDFLADTLMATPTDYDIVIVGHTFLKYQSVSQDGATGFCSFHSLVSAFKAKTNVKISTWVHTQHDGEYDAPVAVYLVGDSARNYNFSGSTFEGRVFCIQGHCHADGAFITSASAVFVTPTTLNAREYDGSTLNSNEILTIITDCDSYSGSECVWGTHQTKTPNSVTEQIIDVITIGEDDKIHCTRIGAGVDREFNV